MTDRPLTPIGVIGHYNLLERIESAGAGEMYRARDTKAGRTVALRLLPSDVLGDRASTMAVLRDVQALSHPNAVTVFDVGEHDGRVYLVFEFLKGRSLRAEMGGRPVPVRRAVDVAIQIADAVAVAHAAGFGHSGLSPDAVVITGKGHAKIPVHELAVQSGAAYAIEGRLIDYEAPEEARGEPADDRSDVYSIGAILYDMLTMRRPLPRGSAAPSASNPRVPAAIDSIVLRAVAPNADSRYQSAATLAADLRAAAAALQADDDDQRAVPAPATSVRSIVMTTLIMLAAVAAIAWWIMRS